MIQVDRISLTDPALESRPEGATNVAINGLPGWEKTYTEGSDAWQQGRVIAIEARGYRYYLIGTFGPGADQTTFATVADSFRIR